MATGNTLCKLPAGQNQPPATNFASIDTRNNLRVLDFDAATAEDAIFSDILPSHYGGGGLTLIIIWLASSATSGDVKWNAAIERNADGGTDIDTDSFAAAQTVTATAPATSGIFKYSTITFTSGAQMDSLAAGEHFRIKITRDAADGADTMTGDAEYVSGHLKET